MQRKRRGAEDAAAAANGSSHTNLYFIFIVSVCKQSDNKYTKNAVYQNLHENTIKVYGKIKLYAIVMCI